MRVALRGLQALALVVPASALAQVSAPLLTARTIQQLPKPLPSPYDAAADARQQIAAAATRARAGGKRLLIDFGANWCLDCRVFAGVVAMPEMRGWMARHFELVVVDVGRFDRNLDIAARFGVKLAAVPALFVVDPGNARLINRAEIHMLSGASTSRPQQMADWLAKWASRR